MSDKKKKGRRAYLSDYTMNVNGEYVYTGEYYTAHIEGKEFNRYMRAVMTLEVAAFVLLAAVGCLSTGTASGAFYVTLPHVAAIVLGAVCVYDCGVIISGKGKLKAHQYETSVNRLKSLSIAGAVCAFVAAVGQAGYIVFAGGNATRAADIAFMAGCVAAAAVFLVTIRLQNAVMWQKYTK